MYRYPLFSANSLHQFWIKINSKSGFRAAKREIIAESAKKSEEKHIFTKELGGQVIAFQKGKGIGKNNDLKKE